MKHLYDISGNKLNAELGSTMLWKSMFATLTCNADLSVSNSYTWGEEVNGSTETPFTDMQEEYNCTPSQADCRLLTYEDGSPIIEDGKIYISSSTQIGRGAGGAIIMEHKLGTTEMRITGCIMGIYEGARFSATGNAIMYNRNNGHWLLLSHSMGTHILVKADCISDPRFGITTAYYEQMDYQNPGSGDEDQFVFYSSEISKWVMISVAIRNNDANYLLRMHTSDYYDHGYTFVRQVDDSSVLRATGVSSTKIGGTRYVLSGSSATGTNKFLVYSFPALEYVCELSLDYDTGARHGVWPMVFPVTDGEKTRYQFLTFDRAPLIEGNRWSYGCLYMFCAAETNTGMEFPIKRDGLTVYTAAGNDYDPEDLHFKRKWALRNPMDTEMVISEIKLDQTILYDQSNFYPVIGAVGVTQDTSGVYLEEDGSAILVGGEHNPFACYRLNSDGIQGTDRRSLVIFGASNAVKLRVSVTKDGKVYGYNGSAETLLGTMREDSKELLICTSWNTVYLFEH